MTYTHDKCPDCGKIKCIISTRCRKCAHKHQTGKPRGTYTTTPREPPAPRPADGTCHCGKPGHTLQLGLAHEQQTYVLCRQHTEDAREGYCYNVKQTALQNLSRVIPE